MAVAKRTFCNSSHCATATETMKFEVTHFSNIVHIPYYDVSKKHICAYSADRTSDTALLPRPRTRRNPDRWNPEETIDRKYRSQSVGGIPRKLKILKKNHGSSSCHSNTDQDSVTEEVSNYHYIRYPHHNKRKKRSIKSNSCSTNNGIEEEEDITSSSRRSSEKKSGTGDSKSRGSSANEHEYLQFLLRVTEDIIINNYIMNEDIEKVFKQHIEMNKHVLDEKKMEQHIANLAVELNISESQTKFLKDNSHPCPPTYVNLHSLSTSCQCEIPNDPLENFFTQITDQNKDYKENLDDIIYHRHSLGRVTECTEPSNSSATVAAKISNPNFLLFGNTEHQMTETKSEMVVASNENIGKELQIRETLSEIVITDKSSPTDSLKDDVKAYTIEQIKDIKEHEAIEYVQPISVGCSTETTIETKADAKVQANLPPKRAIEQSIQTSPRLLQTKPSTVSKATQSTSIVSNKKCDTLDLNEYVSVTHPKQTECSPSQDNVVIPDLEIPLSNRTELEGLDNFLELKLLGDDYDLTPERDTSEKYHFLKIDAATSMAPQTAAFACLEEDSLLLGDSYELHEEQTTAKRMQTCRNSYSFLMRKKSMSSEDETSSSSGHALVYKESPRKVSCKNESRYSSYRKHGKFESDTTKVNTCTSTSSTSVRT